MPLTPAGSKIMANMMNEYGSKKGESVFYAKANKSARFAKLVHKARKRAAGMKG